MYELMGEQRQGTAEALHQTAALSQDIFFYFFKLNEKKKNNLKMLFRKLTNIRSETKHLLGGKENQIFFFWSGLENK